jgi:hemerythrin-like domain-containing protein
VKPKNEQTRRGFLSISFGMGAALLLAPPGGKHDEREEEVSPAEDLMREHGVLKRVLLIYGEALRRLDEREEMPPDALKRAAEIIRSFIEDYHEKLEEDFLFPRFARAKKLVDLVGVLRDQHQAGRQLTDKTLRLATLSSIRNPGERGRLASSLRAFIRMYGPHEAREDTVLFPALRAIVTAHEYGALGEEFEKKEHELFGREGFEKIVERVAGIEKRLGIYELAQFTPKA